MTEVVTANTPVPVHRMGFPGFLPTGSVEWLLEHFGLTADGVAQATRGVLVRKRK